MPRQGLATLRIAFVEVEFYGIARQRAGQASVQVEVAAGGTTVAAILEQLSSRFPNLVGECWDERGLCSGYLANVDGTRFVSDLSSRVLPGQSLLILSADAGG